LVTDKFVFNVVEGLVFLERDYVGVKLLL